jgi:hypothetical protein
VGAEKDIIGQAESDRGFVRRVLPKVTPSGDTSVRCFLMVMMQTDPRSITIGDAQVCL